MGGQIGVFVYVYDYVYEIILTLSLGEPDGFFAAGVEEAGKSFQSGGADPGLHLGGGGSAGGEDSDCFPGADPAGLDPGEVFLPRVGVDGELQSAGGQLGAVAFHGCLQPATGGRVVVLVENLAGSGEAGSSPGEISTKEEEVAAAHSLGDAAKEREGIEIR